MEAPEAASALFHGIQGGEADDSPNSRVGEGAGGGEEPEGCQGEVSARGQGGEKLVPESSRNSAFPERVKSAGGVGAKVCAGAGAGGGCTWASPRSDVGAWDAVKDHPPEGFLDPEGAREGPRKAQEGGKLGRG